MHCHPQPESWFLNWTGQTGYKRFVFACSPCHSKPQRPRALGLASKFLTRTYKLALVSLTSNPGTVISCPDCSNLTGLASMSPFSEGSCYVTQTGFQHLGSSNPASGSHLSSFFNSHFILCICVLWPHVYPCTMCVPGACSIQKEGVSSPELEGQAVVSGPSRRTASTLTAEPSLSSLSPCPPYSP